MQIKDLTKTNHICMNKQISDQKRPQIFLELRKRRNRRSLRQMRHEDMITCTVKHVMSKNNWSRQKTAMPSINESLLPKL